MRRRRELLESLDTHIARGNELMGELRPEFERNRLAARENSKLVSQMVDRNERSHRQIMQGLNDLSEDVKAHTAAILALLDRLNPGEEPS